MFPVGQVLCKDGRCVAGAGACEIDLAYHIQQVAESTPGLEQYAISKFAEALEVVPRTLAENSGQNAADVLSSLYAAHAAGSATVGVNIEVGVVAAPVGGGGVVCAPLNRVCVVPVQTEGVLDVAACARPVYDVLATKASALSLAADAAVTVLRVDQIIMAKQAGGPKPRDPQAPDAD